MSPPNEQLTRSSATSPFSDTTWLKESLIQQPSSDQDHLHNLALCAAHPELMLELGFRQIFPTITHATAVKLMNQPEFKAKLLDCTRAKSLTKWPVIVETMADRAITLGDVSAAKFVAQVLGLMEQSAAEQSADDVINKLSTSLAEVMAKQKKPKVVEVEAQVK